MGYKMISQAEHVARAFHDAEYDGQSWDNAPEGIKEEFRLYAREAIALSVQLQQQRQVDGVGPAAGNLSKAA
jgi:hypothetical protein